MTTHFFGDGCDHPHGAPCEHLSATGVDQAEGDDKLWRCDTCGLLHRWVAVDGISRMVPA